MSLLSHATTSLQARLLLAHLLVIATGVVTLLLAATLVGPSFFDRHMAQMGATMPGPGRGMFMAEMQATMAARLTETFHQALVESLGLAALAALVAAALASILVSERVAGPVHRVARASQRIARGHYAERVPPAGRDEVGQLVQSFNVMAAALEDSEQRRLELIGDVAHELRTPIATLEGYLEGLLDGVVEPSEATWARLHAETRRLHRLVEDLQELSRAEAHQIALVLGAVEPATIVQAAVGRLAPDFAARELDLHVEVPATLPAVRADPDRAVQVLTNLLTNALRYTSPPGRVVVSARLADDAIRVAVTDSGIGIAPEELTHVFDRFYRVDKSRSRQLGGTGIGLTIAKMLVEAMDGRIWAQSLGLGEGATFAFELPLWSKKSRGSPTPPTRKGGA